MEQRTVRVIKMIQVQTPVKLWGDVKGGLTVEKTDGLVTATS